MNNVRGLSVNPKVYGINNVLAKDFTLPTIRKYVNVYSEKKGIRFILSDEIDEKAIFTYELNRACRITLPKAVINNIDPAEETEFEKISLDEYFVKCSQKKILKPLKGVFHKDIENVLDLSSGQPIGLEITHDYNSIYLPFRVLSMYNMPNLSGLNANSSDGDSVRAVFHFGNPCCIELLLNNVAPNKKMSTIEEVKGYYGTSLKQVIAKTIVCDVDFRRSSIKIPKSFLKRYGFLTDDVVDAMLCDNGIMLLPAKKKSAISGTVIDGVNEIAEKMNVCEECADRLEEETVETTKTGVQGEIAQLMEVAQALLEAQKAMTEQLQQMAKVKRKVKKAGGDISDLERLEMESNELLRKSMQPLYE